jgi:hypothetical protein
VICLNAQVLASVNSYATVLYLHTRSRQQTKQQTQCICQAKHGCIITPPPTTNMLQHCSPNFGPYAAYKFGTKEHRSFAHCTVTSTAADRH